MEGALARLLESGVTALSSLMVTDAYGQLVRPRLAALLGRREAPPQLPEMDHLDHLSRELADARERGDAETQRSLEGELAECVRQLVAADPGLVEEFVALAQAKTNRDAEVSTHASFSNSTFHGPVQGHGVQNNTFQGGP